MYKKSEKTADKEILFKSYHFWRLRGSDNIDIFVSPMTARLEVSRTNVSKRGFVLMENRVISRFDNSTPQETFKFGRKKPKFKL